MDKSQGTVSGILYSPSNCANTIFPTAGDFICEVNLFRCKTDSKEEKTVDFLSKSTVFLPGADDGNRTHSKTSFYANYSPFDIILTSSLQFPLRILRSHRVHLRHDKLLLFIIQRAKIPGDNFLDIYLSVFLKVLHKIVIFFLRHFTFLV